MSKLKPTEKFIGYIDILGYSALTKAAESGNGLSFDDLDEILKLLGNEERRKHHQEYGPTTCPKSPRIREDLDFQIAQAWDSVVVSTEISPAGLINLISHCFGACIMLLTKGVMCRGYIKKGMIYHEGQKVFGSGHTDAVAKEKQVAIFKRGADERGTPFIEVDSEVTKYVETQPDKCVKEMFSRMVITHDGLTAIFPIKRLAHSFIIGGFNRAPFDPQKEKNNNNVMRNNLKKLKDKIRSYVDPSDASAVAKCDHYLRALDEQLKVCDQTDEMIDALGRPFGVRATPDNLPGLFR